MDWWKCLLLIPAVLLTALVGPVAADSDSTPVEGYFAGTNAQMERFRLFTDCSPMLVWVELSDDAKRILLTHKPLTAAAESRLRAAQLFGIRMFGPRLYVAVHVVGPAFSVSVKLAKSLWDQSSRELDYAVTWHTAMWGTHSSDRNYIVSALQQQLDTFMAAYLRVNEEAC